jgi:hypothetical protein
MIDDGVRRAKAVDVAGGPNACVTCEVWDESLQNVTDVLDVPVKDLRSPYSTIDATGPKGAARWDYAKASTADGTAAPVQVRPGSQGTPIPDVEVIE